MFKEIRSLLQMLGELDAEETGERPAPDGDAATAGRCSALVLDSDLASARGLADTLAESGIAATIHGDRGGFAAAVAATSPALVFIDVNGQGDDAIDALVTMSEHR